MRRIGLRLKNGIPDISNSVLKNELIHTKEFHSGGKVVVAQQPMCDYLNSVEAYEQARLNNEKAARPAYWHDVPIFEIFNELIDDVPDFDPHLVPPFYASNWSKFVQFFLSPAGSVTKLHFDTLRTHNLFFQVSGRKKWVIFPPQDIPFCGRLDWRWFDVDPEKPDLHRYPEYEHASPTEVIVESGDLFYIPPGTLHQVTSLDTCISFNIDFHTTDSVLDSFRYVRQGMPKKVMYYNLISLLGVTARFSSNLLLPFYRSYLNYVS